MISGVATAAMVAIPKFRRWRAARTCAFLALGAMSFIPILHGVQRYGLQEMLQYAGLRWYLLELTLYGASAGLYAVCVALLCIFHLLTISLSDHILQFRLPERLAPGVFDIWGSSHQIFHVAILGAFYAHATALTQALTSLHTTDFCATQAILS